MASLTFKEVFSCFFSKVEAYDFLTLTDQEVDEFLCSWIRSAISKPYVRKLFTNVSLDNENDVITYEMRYSVDNESDHNFVCEVLGIGVVIQWIEPKINSTLNINQMYGSKEEKYYSQAAHLKELRDLRDSMKKEQRGMIRDRGYVWNTYLDGE